MQWSKARLWFLEILILGFRKCITYQVLNAIGLLDIEREGSIQVFCIFLFWGYFPSRNCPTISVLKPFEVLAHHVIVFKRIDKHATRNIWY